jgi:hypothetical protein
MDALDALTGRVSLALLVPPGPDNEQVQVGNPGKPRHVDLEPVTQPW